MLPDDPSADPDLAFWDEVAALVNSGVEEASYAEVLHPRDRSGKWMAKLGFKHYEVGGAVRDSLLGKDPKDIDYMAIAPPEEIERRVKAAGGIAMPLTVRDRLVGVRAFHPDLPAEGVEIAPPRIEQSTGSGRHDFTIVPHPLLYRPPDGGIHNPQMLKDDAYRRDFTVNALYRDPATGEILDPTTNGRADVQARVLRTTHPDSFRDDPLRILRGARFASQHGLDVHPGTKGQMIEYADKVNALTQKGVSGTVQTELNKMLTGEHPRAGLELLRDTGVLAHLIPELAPIVGYDQRNVYHNRLLDDHTFDTVQNVATAGGSLEARLAALFHDSGKPETASVKPDGHLRFHSHPERGNHPDVGAEKARAFLTRANYPRDTIRAVETLVKEHMLSAAEKPTPVKIRRLRAQFTDKTLDDLLTHKLADQEGHAVSDQIEGVHELRRLLAAEQGSPRSLKDLAISGDDLVAMGMSGPAIGAMLKQLLAEVVDQPKLNTRDWLLSRAGRLTRYKPLPSGKPLHKDTPESFWERMRAIHGDDYGPRGMQEGVFDEALHPRDAEGHWTKKLIDLATEAHAGQVDKQGVDYMEHIKAVTRAVSEEAKPVAVFHDALEDTKLTAADLKGHLTDDEIAAVKLLTRNREESYDQYIDRLRAAEGRPGRLAREVKVMDVRHNISRMTDKIRASHPHLELRYRKAVGLLLDDAEQEWWANRKITPEQHQVIGGALFNTGVRWPAATQGEGRWTADEYQAVTATLAEALKRYPKLVNGPMPIEITRSAGAGRHWQVVKDSLPPGTMLAISVEKQNQTYMMLAINDAWSLNLTPENTNHLAPASASGVAGLMWHEVGHALTYAHGIDDASLPRSEREQRIRDFCLFYGITADELIGLSEYAATTPIEGFAELSAMIHAPGFADQLDPELRAKGEKMFKALEGELQWKPA